MVFIAILLLAPAPRLEMDDPSHLAIVEAASEMLAIRFPDVVHHLEVRVIRTSRGINGNKSLRVIWPASNDLPRAHTQVKIEQQVPDGTQWTETGWALLYVAHFDSVALATRPIERDEQIVDGDLQFAWLETTRFSGQPLTRQVYAALQSQGELYAHRHLNANRTLRSDTIRPAYDVETSQSVTMTYRRDPVALELACKARMTGYTGDIIKLFSPVSKRTYRARITGPGTAEWLETLE